MFDYVRRNAIDEGCYYIRWCMLVDVIIQRVMTRFAENDVLDMKYERSKMTTNKQWKTNIIGT